MSETAKVRLVRCPKCENLLPEVTDYSVYQCGGCGAVLKANNKGVDLDTISQKSDEERIEHTVEKLSDRYEKNMNVSEKRMMEMSDGSESDVRSSISSSSRSERRRILRGRAENNRTSLINKDEMWDSADLIQDKKSNELQQAKNAQDFENLGMYNARNGVKGEIEGFGRAQRIDADITGYTKEGPSNLVSRSNYAYENADYVGEDRAELLKKLDELTTQLSRSGNLIDKGKEKVSFDRRTTHPDPYENSYPDASLEMNRPQFRRPSYHDQYPEPPPLMHRQEMRGNGFYPPQYGATHVQGGYTDPLRSHMLRRGPHQTPTPYEISPSHAYMSGPYMDDDRVYMDTVDPYPSNINCHHPSCPCYQCLTKRQVPPRVLPKGDSDKYYHVTNDKMFDYRDNSGSSFGTRDYNNHGIPDPRPLRSHNAQSHARWPSDVNSEADAFVRRRPAWAARMHLPSSGQYCRPLAGGAPFLTCYNCFELLLLPKKVLTKNNNNKKKMRCGSCSTVIIFVVSNKNLVISMATDIPVNVDNNRAVHLSQARTTFSSDDYDNSGYDFHSMERAKNSTEMKSRHLTSSYTSEAEEDRESNLSGPRKHLGPADMSTKDKVRPPPAGSSLQDYFEHSNKYHVANRLGEGNKSGRSENEKPLPDKITTRRKESSATEIDISSNEYANTGTTFDSGEGSKEGDNLKGSRAESFFAGIRKKSFKDSQRSNGDLEQEKANVTVNGHLIPDRLIKKAEKLAGPISPGNYWYDFRAGFWGAMGGPCLGIIPPFIEEFNYPIPDRCAGGNTHVYVNGRELDQKDLKLLGSRGLPTESDRSYIVEISGRVLDEDTGEELESLGKLAPTVERVKHGFGMRVPSAVASK